MTWNYFMPNEKPPVLIEIVQDNDLWRHKIPHCQKLIRWIRSFPQTFEAWDDISTLLTIQYNECIREAEAIERYYWNQLEAQMGLAVPIDIGSNAQFRGSILNCAKQYASDIGHKLDSKERHDFGATYFIRSDGKAEISLRSESIDVSDIAKRFGGGGHHKAAGFSVNADELMMYISRGYI
jgi:oligoribonuclease NrnB/cAMP/cGMP phosphodiesterase (DHH superfamily)